MYNNNNSTAAYYTGLRQGERVCNKHYEGTYFLY